MQKFKVTTQAYAGREGIIVKEMSTIEERFPALCWNEKRGVLSAGPLSAHRK